jgi:hypothetical protein
MVGRLRVLLGEQLSDSAPLFVGEAASLRERAQLRLHRRPLGVSVFLRRSRPAGTLEKLAKRIRLAYFGHGARLQPAR